ncbi:hypothetical protein [Gracilimonas mengyeensis]|uniref:DUF3887 domain-containing protein n=1 Tax=Gracilimonas mengyeensis TaxID=1302730 RepID=A0A521C600_9BACT|nr:hypothetical protein [Gracilimonas mengyeensis]SMO54876.1 hypothetical protein SAMN06265219_104199 [Gracilimonas mengyeensis]
MDYFGSFGPTPGEALSVLEPVLRTALQAHEKGEYEAYTEIITEELRAKISKENFLKAHKEIAPQLGEFQSLRFLGSLNKEPDPLLVFSASYSATIDDILIRVAFKNETEPPKIKWLWIE